MLISPLICLQLHLSWMDIERSVLDYAWRHLPTSLQEMLKPGQSQPQSHSGKPDSQTKPDQPSEAKREYGQDEDVERGTDEKHRGRYHQEGNGGSNQENDPRAGNNLWMDTIMQLLNQTRGQLQHTWQQVMCGCLSWVYNTPLM